MSDYDFKQLNDKEFEILCSDLLGEVEGRRFERFKAGKDAGVDGRFFADKGKEVILQCKHWCNTPLKQLVHTLSTVEKPKIDKLKPNRYLLIVSNPLSRADKKTIHRALVPYVVSESDIYGKEDLNDLLKSKPHIERRHYKLWLHSSSVLEHIFNNAIIGRSMFSLEEIIRTSARYVVTANHQAALKILDKLGVVIITGAPGIGKTTLADHLCLHYTAQGFAYLKIAEDIREAESAFDPESRQVFYFDDFLGRNYLEALKGHEGSHISQFIRRIVTNKNKRFVLTSRSTILNQGKQLIDSFDHNNIQQNEYELRIQSLTDMDKAQILYNHIWHSELNNDFIEQLYLQRRYRNIIKHKNFNPRLINYTTDASRLDSCSPTDYWEHINRSLTNPSQIWENPFIAQQDDFGRALILLVALNGHALDENILAEAYQRYIALPENQNLHGRREFRSNIRQLTGSFFNRTISHKKVATIDLFNPSIGDYLLERYAGDEVAFRLGMLSLRTLQSLMTLRSLMLNVQLSKKQTFFICDAIIKQLVNENFENTSTSYVSLLCDIYRNCGCLAYEDTDALQTAAMFILKKSFGSVTDDSFKLIKWAVEQHIVSSEQALDFIVNNHKYIDSEEEIKAILSLLSTIPETTPGYAECEKSARKYIIDLVVDNFSEFIDVMSAFSQVEHRDYREAYRILKKLVVEKLNNFGAFFYEDDIAWLLKSYDVEDELDQYFENIHDDYDQGSESPAMLAIDEIDDLFERN